MDRPAPHHRRAENEFGFSIVEMMVATVILALLVAVSLPMFLNAGEQTRDRAAQATARNAFAAGRAVSTDDGTFGPVGAFVATLTAMEPGLTFTDASSQGSNHVSAATEDGGDADSLGDVAFYAVLSETGDCFHLRDAGGDNSDGSISYAIDAGAATCEADNRPQNLSWSTAGW